MNKIEAMKLIEHLRKEYLAIKDSKKRMELDNKIIKICKDNFDSISNYYQFKNKKLSLVDD